jgi:glutamyl/glutaminyl-tRNA synthetase
LGKLNWINNQYIKKELPEKLADLIVPLLVEKQYIRQENFDSNYIISLVKLFQARISTLNDFADWADFFFVKDIKISEELQKKFFSQDLSKEIGLFIERLESLDKFDTENIEISFRSLVSELNIEAKTLVHPIRVALTGKTIGPGLFEIIYYLGIDRTKERLTKCVERRQDGN